MKGKYHFTKGSYVGCDREGEFLQGVFSANVSTQQTIIREFDRYLKDNSISQEAAIKAIRMRGAVVTRNGLWNYRRGEFKTCTNTLMNILSRYCGYKDFEELIITVHSRNN